MAVSQAIHPAMPAPSQTQVQGQPKQLIPTGMQSAASPSMPPVWPGTPNCTTDTPGDRLMNSNSPDLKTKGSKTTKHNIQDHNPFNHPGDRLMNSNSPDSDIAEQSLIKYVHTISAQESTTSMVPDKPVAAQQATTQPFLRQHQPCLTKH